MRQTIKGLGMKISMETISSWAGGLICLMTGIVLLVSSRTPPPREDLSLQRVLK